MESLGDKIYKLRNDAGMSQDTLAERLNISRQTVSRWETDNSKPTNRHINSLCEIFGVDKNYFFNADGITVIKLNESSEISVSKEKESGGVRAKPWKVFGFAIISVLLIVCIIACGYAGYVTISPNNINNLNIRIVNRFKWVGIVCLAFGALALAALVTLWIFALKNRKKFKK